MAISTHPLTLTEFLSYPETKPASEFAEGRIYQKPMPQGKHSKLQTSLVTQINRWGEPNRLVYALTELRCTVGGRSIVPDIAVFRWANLPLDDNDEIRDRVEIAPDWAIEILSPEQSPTRPMDNLLFLLQQGTVLGWLVDPYERLVFAFQGDRAPVTLRDAFPFPLLSDLGNYSLTAAELFALLHFSR